MSGLRIAKGVQLPVEYVTKVAAIVAQRRKGKTYTASVLAEELVAAQLPFVVVDPTGAWWGLRSSADGKKPGLPVTILGGAHGDVPIDHHSGRVVADLVCDHPSWYVCDLSLFDSHEQERTFVRALVERLYRRKGQPGMDFPLHVIVDEADLYAPEQPLPGDQLMLGAFKTMVKRGGIRGIGVTVITQRPASLSKHVLEQADMLILLRIVGPNDRAAVDRYVKANAEGSQRDDLLRSLPSLRLGEAWLWEPGGEPPLFMRVQIRERRTFNSSATPKTGERLVEPTVLALVDLDAVKEQLAAIVARAEADNPDRLRDEITQLRRELADALAEAGTAAPAETVEQLVAPVEWFNAITETVDAAAGIGELLDEVGAGFARIRSSLQQAIDDVGNLPVRRADEFAERRRPDRTRIVPRVEQPDDTPITHASGEIALPPVDVPRGGVEYPRDGDVHLLDVLAWLQSIGVDEIDRASLGLFAGVSPKSSSYGRALARLQSGGEIEYPQGGYVMLTDAGRRRAKPQSTITTNEQLHAELCRQLPAGQAKIVAALTTMSRREIGRDALADRAGLSPSSSQYGRDLAALVRYGFIRYPSPGIVAAVVERLWPIR